MNKKNRPIPRKRIKSLPVIKKSPGMKMNSRLPVQKEFCETCDGTRVTTAPDDPFDYVPCSDCGTK